MFMLLASVQILDSLCQMWKWLMTQFWVRAKYSSTELWFPGKRKMSSQARSASDTLGIYEDMLHKVNVDITIVNQCRLLCPDFWLFSYPFDKLHLVKKILKIGLFYLNNANSS